MSGTTALGGMELLTGCLDIENVGDASTPEDDIDQTLVVNEVY